MIDAITAGVQYELHVKNERHDDDDMLVTFHESDVTFHDNFDTYVVVNDPRVAREIAGALVAWANRKDPSATAGFPPFVLSESSRETHFEEATESGNREEWYRQNVQRMGYAMKNRNLRDLEAAYNGLHPNSEEAVDILGAIHILRSNGAE